MTSIDGRTEYRVPMRDGVALATDVYLPASWAEGPVVLVRLPYGKRDRYVFLDRCAPYFNERGFAFVVQDVRGTGESEGETLPYVHEVHDGYDTIEWITRQPWSNGAVGMFGDSYYGYTQWAALASRHPALKALVPRMSSVELPFAADIVPPRTHTTATDAGPGLPPTQVGLGRPPSVGWAMGLATIWSGAGDDVLDIDLSVKPPLAAFEAAFKRAGHRSEAFDRTIPVHRPDPVFPDGHPFEADPVPVLHCVGWFDPIAKRGLAAYEYLRDLPHWGDLQYLLADSVDHENYHLDDVPIGEYALHDESDEALERLLPRYLGPALDFFDVHLASRSDITIPRVRWHLGHVADRVEESWPPAQARPLTFFLRDLAVAGRTDATGRLDPATPETPELGEWIHDPGDPVVSQGSTLSMICDFPDERSTSSRADVMVFDTTAAEEAMDLAGPVSVTLTIESTGPSTDVFVNLLDVYPDGSVHRLVGDQVTVELEDRPRTIDLELGHAGYRVLPGHRLRLHVASSEAPHFLVHPGVAGNRWTTSASEPRVQAIHSSPSTPSALRLTVLPGVANR